VRRESTRDAKPSAGLPGGGDATWCVEAGHDHSEVCLILLSLRQADDGPAPTVPRPAFGRLAGGVLVLLEYFPEWSYVALEATTEEAQIMSVDREQRTAYATAPGRRIRKGVKTLNKRRELQTLPGWRGALELEPAAMRVAPARNPDGLG
jgi:hypothetical protein